MASAGFQGSTRRLSVAPAAVRDRLGHARRARRVEHELRVREGHLGELARGGRAVLVGALREEVVPAHDELLGLAAPLGRLLEEVDHDREELESLLRQADSLVQATPTSLSPLEMLRTISPRQY